MKKLVLLFSLFSSLSVFSFDGRNGERPETAYVEAIVTVGGGDCGYLLKLNNGNLIRPTNLPKKYQKRGEKVVVILDDLKRVTNSPCDVQKEVHIVEIKPYKPNPNCHSRL